MDFEQMDVYLFDSDSHTASVTRQAFAQAGVSSPNLILDRKKLIDILHHSRCDLLALDCEHSEGQRQQIIRDLRSGNCEINDRMRIVALTSQPTRELINEVIHAGADGVLVKPLVPAKIHHLIEQLTVNGPDYVVTPDYVGPNRRRLPDQEAFEGEERRHEEAD